MENKVQQWEMDLVSVRGLTLLVSERSGDRGCKSRVDTVVL